MTFDFSSLEPEIRQILSAPGTDLSTISAKRVRRQLLTLDPSLTPEFLKEHKEDVDEIITRVFEEINSVEQDDETPGTPEPSHAVTKPSKSPKRGASSAGKVDDGAPEDYAPPTKKSKKSSKSQELTDAELARRLSSEINGRNTRTGGKPTKKTSRVKKSAAVADSDASDDGSEKHVRKAKGGFAKEYVLRSVVIEVIRFPVLMLVSVALCLMFFKWRSFPGPRWSNSCGCTSRTMICRTPAINAKSCATQSSRLSLVSKRSTCFA